ncbi:hypothetical protein QFZ52_002744 [Arthrobacter woluwensis]|uniref:hypothetical protein n=1 Tax=Arthrobacter woluwensis TaxID=156980 RepID=UPI00278A618E|nr:hypothetical protein [Arthrobacter woluwensis]MDQ0710092.1 hypothetical protein [Arthrobacter woluwensis]
MNNVILIAHVIGAIVLIGPPTAAASIFPRHLTVRASGETEPEGPDDASGVAAQNPTLLAALHRLTRVYSTLGAVVPALGIILAARMGILSDGWVITSMALTVLAALILAFAVVPLQREALQGAVERSALLKLRASAGAFAVLWAVVVALMILRPGASA